MFRHGHVSSPKFYTNLAFLMYSKYSLPLPDGLKKKTGVILESPGLPQPSMSTDALSKLAPRWQGSSCHFCTRLSYQTCPALPVAVCPNVGAAVSALPNTICNRAIDGNVCLPPADARSFLYGCHSRYTAGPFNDYGGTKNVCPTERKKYNDNVIVNSFRTPFPPMSKSDVERQEGCREQFSDRSRTKTPACWRNVGSRSTKHVL